MVYDKQWGYLEMEYDAMTITEIGSEEGSLPTFLQNQRDDLTNSMIATSSSVQAVSSSQAQGTMIEPLACYPIHFRIFFPRMGRL